ncbi:MAG: hypothetical protein ACQGVK_09950 [Myxococcota bacterium]
MREKPKGRKYRNLTAYRGSIWYERVVNGRRVRWSLECTSWEEATKVRDLYEEQKGIGQRRFGAEPPTFGQLAKRFLEEDAPHRLSRTTLASRKRQLAPGSAILRHLAGRRLDAITPGMLRAWWAAEVDGEERAFSTGRDMLNAIASVFAYARDLELVEASPVEEFRRQLRRRGASKRGRAQPADRIRPIASAEELGRLSEAIVALPEKRATETEERMRNAAVRK